MKAIFTKAWFRAAGVRALRTVAQSALAVIGTAVTLGEVNWLSAASSALLAGILSLITSVAAPPPEAQDERE